MSRHNNISIQVADVDADLIRKLEHMVFQDSRSTKEKCSRIKHQQPLFLIAYAGERAVGFKLGYMLDEDTFYSWLGGVNKAFRRQGIAQCLLEKQEAILKQKKVGLISFKTYPKFKEMIQLGIKNGYTQSKRKTDDGALWFEKPL